MCRCCSPSCSAHETSSHALTDRTTLSLTWLAQSVALSVDQSVRDRQDMLQFTTNDPGVVDYVTTVNQAGLPKSQDYLTAVVKRLQAADPAIDAAGIYDAHGTAVAHSDPATVGRNVAGRDFIQAALSGKTYTSSFRLDRVNDMPGIQLSAPIRSGSTVVGAAATHISGPFIEDLLAKSLQAGGTAIDQHQREAVSLFLVDSNGIIMSSSASSDVLYRSLGAGSEQSTSDIAATWPIGGQCPNGTTTCARTSASPGCLSRCLRCSHLQTS